MIGLEKTEWKKMTVTCNLLRVYMEKCSKILDSQLLVIWWYIYFLWFDPYLYDDWSRKKWMEKDDRDMQFIEGIYGKSVIKF